MPYTQATWPRLFLLIRRLRKECGMTQKQLAAELGVSRSAVAMWESTGNNPAEEILPPLAAALHCPVELFTGYPEEEGGGAVCQR